MKLYRQGVQAIIHDGKDNFLLLQLVSYGNNDWNFPGGGKENTDKTILDTLYREISEELAIQKDDLIVEKKCNVIKYDFPEAIRRGETDYHGQEKQVFWVKFIGNKENITIQEEEIRELEWVNVNELPKYLNFNGQYESFLEAKDIAEK